ncbi:MAG: M14 family zinc carboxypeptidase [Bacteroidetes bacterium]|nr:M14 family zinc carboxypeptidase [Bacteroidota bacterium]
MKNVLFILFLLATAAHISAQTPTYSEVKVHAGAQGFLQLAKLGLAVEDGFHGKDDTWTTVLSADELKKARDAGFRIEIVHADYTRYIAGRNEAMQYKVGYINGHKEEFASPDQADYTVPQHFRLGSMGGFLHLQEVLDELDSMRLHYPNLISVKMAAGNNNTIEGRPVYYVRISNTPNQVTGKPKVLYNALIHAREPMGMQQLIFFMWYLLENYNTSDEVKYLVDNLELCFIPVANPDGYEFNHAISPGGGGQWRKNRRVSGSGDIGVDLNRNFSYKWGYDNIGSSPFPADETYRGTSAFSEPETQVIRDFCAATTLSLSMNYHTYSDYTLYPWCWQTAITSDSALQVTYASYLTKQNGYLSGMPGQILYNTNGDALDWQYGDTLLKPKVLCFTSEIGKDSDGFWPFASRIIPLSQENVFSNLMIAHFALRYAEAHDRSPVILSDRQGYFKFDFMRYGMDNPANYTVSLHPLDMSQFVSTGGPKTFLNPVQLQPCPDSIAYLLKPGVTSGDVIRFVYEINNGAYTFRDTVTKYFGPPLVIFRDSASTMANWVSTKWSVSETQYHSAPGSITDSRTGNYSNNSNAAVSTINGLDLQNSPVAVISYWAKWRTEQGYDYVQFNLSGSNGTWVPQKGRFTKTGFYLEAAGQPLYDGNQPSWVEEQITTTAFASQAMKMQFLLKSDGGLNYDGFYFDDVTVTVVDMTKVGLEPGSPAQVKLFDPVPNPATGQVTIRYELAAAGNTNATLVLTDARGIEAATFPVSPYLERISFSVKDLPAGLYFYRIIGTFGSTQVKKLVITHPTM